ncbi:hypothetical protein G6F40_017962 [Rhizopus arrhizus]|nr:hypothetical protein G6F40_017962 [Rhizopus arrhizus]
MRHAAFRLACGRQVVYNLSVRRTGRRESTGALHGFAAGRKTRAHHGCGQGHRPGMRRGLRTRRRGPDPGGARRRRAESGHRRHP